LSKILLYGFIVSIIFSGCKEHSVSSISRTQIIMNTFTSITLEEKHSQEIQKGFEHLQRLENILSSYKKNADIYQLNLHKKLPSNPILKDILTQSKDYYTQTNGYFDITIGSITKALYGFGEQERIPTKNEIHKALLGLEYIHVTNSSISLHDDVTLDLGGLGKGYGVDSLSSYYHTLGIHKGQIAMSGDLRCLNTCTISIQDPFKDDTTLTTLKAKISDLSISTSGTYRRYIASKQHHHLINPKSKSQSRDFVSVTIVTQANNTLADVMATAISTMPKEIALAFLQDKKEFGYIFVTSKGEVIKGNLERFVSQL